MGAAILDFSEALARTSVEQGVVGIVTAVT